MGEIMYIDIYESVKLSKNYAHLSGGQKDIHQYILANISNINALTVEDIAKNCFCSTTTVNRYCKKMGAEGFSELKHALVEYSDYNQKNEHNTMLNRKMISKTDGLELSQISSIVNVLLEKKQVYIFGTGASYLHAKYLQRLLARCGINAIASNEVHYLRVIKDIESCIIISNTGETFSAIQVAKEFIGNCPVIALTREQSRLARLADYKLTHKEELIVDDSLENELNISTYLMIVSLMVSMSEQLVVND